MEKQCLCCSKKLAKFQRKYCSRSCENRYWKRNNRDTYLAGKKLYREKNRDRIAEYNREIKRQFGDIPDRLRNEMRGGQVCLRCGTHENLNVHHIKAKRHGGDNSMSNLMVLCFKCHMDWHYALDKVLNDYWQGKI